MPNKTVSLVPRTFSDLDQIAPYRVTETDADTIMARLVAVAEALFDGHLTILKFTSNWRVDFGTVDSRNGGCSTMPKGQTFVEAGQAALTKARQSIDAETKRRDVAYWDQAL